MGCNAITPHLVSLAKRLEGKPFHLVASHHQKGEKGQVVDYIRGKGLAASTPNVTVTSFGRHPRVKGNGSVPYYMVFDHTGRMVQHHMCGSYHGGDGLKMIEWVDEMLEKAPEVWLGGETFERHADLAAQVAAKKRLSRAIAQIETLQADGGDPELDRILAGIVSYRDRELQTAERLLSQRPAGVVKHLKALADELGPGETVAPVAERLAELDGSTDLKTAITIAKGLDKIEKRLSKLTPCDRCKRDGMDHARWVCPECRETKGSERAVKSVVNKLEALVADADGLPIHARAEALLAEIR